KPVPTTVFCPLPDATVIVAGAPVVLVRLKLAGVATPLTVAITVYEPSVRLALKVGAVATPLVLVVTVAEEAKVPLAPLPGAAKVTEAPGTRLLNASLTVACNAVAKVALTVALWGVPAVAAMLAGVPALLVKLKLAG